MPTITLYPPAGGYGSVWVESSTWTATRDATTGSVDSASGSFPYIESYSGFSVFRIWRYYIPIDTSSIPDNAIIESASIILDVYSVDNTDSDGNDFISVIQTTQGNSSSLAGADFDNVGTTEGSARINVNDLTTGFGKNSLILNATGLGWIDKTGTTFFGVRSGHDLLNHAIATNTQVTARVYQSTGVWPRLTVSYRLRSRNIPLLGVG